MKSEVLAAIGEGGLHLPAAINAALAANDRVKYAFTLLQMAAAHADQPDQPPASLKRDRLACGIQNESLDQLTAAARRVGPNTFHIPGAAGVLQHIARDMRLMAAPVEGSAARLATLLSAMPATDGDIIEAAALDTMTAAKPPAGSDSLHRLVMDLHRALNTMQAELAEETIDGATAYGLSAADHTRVAAFMAGLNRTARLKFDHPGLATTATRSGDRLVIQNDIGTTDAHVLVIHVEGNAVAVTYTDVHPERLRFFQDLLSERGPAWETARAGQLGSGTQFQMATGRFAAADDAGCCANLTFLGSRLVFLIDWNRARRQLRAFLPGTPRVALLRWAAEQDIGHRAFLALGGARLVNQAIEATAGSAVHFGDRLSDVLGVPETEAFLRFVLRAATDCLLSHGSPSLLRDRIKAELARHFSNEEHRLLHVAADHAGLVFELAALLRDGILEIDESSNGKRAARAGRYEQDADRLVADVREAVRKRPDFSALAPLLHAADDAADELEEGAFLLGLLVSARPDEKVLEPLRALASLLVEVSQEWIKALLDAAHTGNQGSADDADDFLVAIDRVLALEHAADDAERAVTAAAVAHAADFRQLHLCLEVGNRLEEAADALKRAALILRDRVLGEVLNG